MSSSINGVVPSASDISGTSVILIGTSTVTISGNQVFISGQPVSISGNAIRLTSGQNPVQVFAYDPSGDTLRPLIVNQSGGNVLRVDAGAINVASNVSGNVVYLVSGQNPVQLYALDPSGVALRPLIVNQSGSNILRVDAGSISANVSGNAVTVSGNMVSISGQPVSVSGNVVVASVTTNISGQTVYLVSGQNNVQMSGETVIISDGSNIPTVTTASEGVNPLGQFLQTVGAGYGFDVHTQSWNRLKVTSSGKGISGIAHKLAVTFSGDSIIGSVSGNAVAVSGQAVLVSGQLVAVSGTVAASVSGNMVSISGQPVSVSGNVVVASVTTNISGQTVYTASGNNEVKLMILDGSGGNLLPVATSTSGIGRIPVVIFDPANANTTTVGSISDTEGTASMLKVRAFTLGYDENTGQGKRLRVTSSGEGISGALHKLIVAFSGDPVSVSGNQIIVSGNVQIVDGSTRATVAGSLSDSTNDSNFLKTSTLNMGYDQTTDQWKRLRVTSSGQVMSGIHYKLAVTFSGDSIIGSVSGNAVAMSGQTVSLFGETVAVSGQVTTSVSGNMVSISGQPTYLVSGQNPVQLYAFDLSGVTLNAVRVHASGSNTLPIVIADGTSLASYAGIQTPSDTVGFANSLRVLSFTEGYDQVTDQMKRVRVTASGQGMSGIHHRLAVAISGDSVTPVVPVQIRTRDTLLITGASGGVALLSGDVMRVTLRNIGISGTVMFVGGSGDYPWVASGQSWPMFSGRGQWLRDGDGMTILTSNMAFVRVVSHTSGQYVSYLGEQY